MSIFNSTVNMTFQNKQRFNLFIFALSLGENSIFINTNV